MNKLFLLLLPHLVVGEGETGHVYGGIYVNEQSKTPDLHIESPDGGEKSRYLSRIYLILVSFIYRVSNLLLVSDDLRRCCTHRWNGRAHPD